MENQNTPKTIQWVKALFKNGLPAWVDEHGNFAPPYPEVTGYIIPTLLEWGEVELAKQMGAWLVTVQDDCGAFHGLDGLNRSFDTAACLEGLEELKRVVVLDDDEMIAVAGAIYRATTWLYDQFEDGSHIPMISPGIQTKNHIYNIRAAAIYHLITGSPWDWGALFSCFHNYRGYTNNPLGTERSHYLAYALEGLWRLANKEQQKILKTEIHAAVSHGFRRDVGLMGFELGSNYDFIGGTDAPATAQFACLCQDAKLQMDYIDLMDGLSRYVDDAGGIMQGVEDKRRVSWGAKYYLDALPKPSTLYVEGFEYGLLAPKKGYAMEPTQFEHKIPGKTITIEGFKLEPESAPEPPPDTTPKPTPPPAQKSKGKGKKVTGKGIDANSTHPKN